MSFEEELLSLPLRCLDTFFAFLFLFLRVALCSFDELGTRAAFTGVAFRRRGAMGIAPSRIAPGTHDFRKRPVVHHHHREHCADLPHARHICQRCIASAGRARASSSRMHLLLVQA